MNLPGIVGDVMVWDFGFKYNLPMMELDELKVIMVKYEIELKRSAEGSDRFREVTEILGRIYREIMKRRMVERLEKIRERI
jgi:hypothetical protein